jgi:BolA family transcriptional regulator, general stress-responsive regulator
MSDESRIAERIKHKLQSGLTPLSLDVIDDSRRHAKHQAAVAHAAKTGRSGETHFKIKVVSESFRGKTHVARHRMINDLLSAEFADGVHALSIEARAPGE